MARSKKPRCNNCHLAWIENATLIGCCALPPKVRFLVSPSEVSPVCKDWEPTSIQPSKGLTAELTPSNIKAIRYAANMTQKTFAAFIGASVASLNRWENGRIAPKNSRVREAILSMSGQTKNEEPKP